MTQLSNNYTDEIRALVAAGNDDAREALFDALSDRRPKVAREARYALAESFVVPRKRLLRLYATTRVPHTGVHVLALLARGQRCDSMVSLLEAVAAVAQPKSRAQACGYVDEWLRKWAPLPPDEVRRLAWAIWEAEDALPPELLARLKAYVRELRGLPPQTQPRAATPTTKPRVAVARNVKTRSPRLEFLDGRVVHRRYEVAPTWLARCRGLLRV
jgi:hypothetical protein